MWSEVLSADMSSTHFEAEGIMNESQGGFGVSQDSTSSRWHTQNHGSFDQVPRPATKQ
jgi:hypothetical protein